MVTCADGHHGREAGLAHVTQADIARALRAARQVGSDWVVEVMPDGVIRIAQSSPDRAQGRDPQATLAPEHNWRL
jgi:hypothetical protein